MVVHRTRIMVVTGDLAVQEVDALIHPTNNYFWFSPGLSENLKRIGGEYLETAAINAGPVEVGQAVILPGGRLKCRWLIHAAAWGQDLMTSVAKIRQAINAALCLAAEKQCVSVALPPAGVERSNASLVHAVEATFLAIVEHCLQATTLREIRLLAADSMTEDLLHRLIRSALSANPPVQQEPSKEEPV